MYSRKLLGIDVSDVPAALRLLLAQLTAVQEESERAVSALEERIRSLEAREGA